MLQNDSAENYYHFYNLHSFVMYAEKSLGKLGQPFFTHFCPIIPTKSCKPMRAKTHRKKQVRIRTSESIFIDFRRVLTMAFNPGNTKTQNKKLPTWCARRTYERGTRARLSFSGGPHAPVNMAGSMENAGSWTVSGSKK